MISLIMYKTEQGNELVREWLKELDSEVRKEIGAGLRSVQADWPMSNRRPLVGAFGRGLYELRAKVDEIQYRIIFCIEEATMVLSKRRKRPPNMILN